MRFENQSKFYPSEKFIEIIEFVEARSSLSDLATLIVMDAQEPGMQTAGMAWKNRPDVGPLSLVAPALIRLTVSRCLIYPQRSGHGMPGVIEKLGYMLFKSWEEEVLFVLAHEQGHVNDFYSRTFENELEAELSAEKFAMWVLKAWRKRKKQLSYASAI